MEDQDDQYENMGPGNEGVGLDDGDRVLGKIMSEKYGQDTGQSEPGESSGENEKYDPDKQLERARILARQESKFRSEKINADKKIQDLESRYKSTHSELEKEREFYKNLKEAARKDPGKILSEFGLTVDDIVSRELEGDDYGDKEKPKSREVRELEEKLARLESRDKEREERQERERREEKERQEKERQEYEQKFIADTKKAVHDEVKSGNYPCIEASFNQDLVYQVIEQTLIDSQGKTLLTAKEASDKVEKHLSSHYEKAGFRRGEKSQSREERPYQRPQPTLSTRRPAASQDYDRSNYRHEEYHTQEASKKRALDRLRWT